MGLKIEVDSLDDVDEKYHDLYTQRGDKYIITEIDGMKTAEDVDRLDRALRKERADHKEVRGRLSLLGDRKIEDVIEQLDRIPELEAAASGKLDETKLDELVQGRLKSRLAPVERERDTFRTKAEEAEKAIATYQAAERLRRIQDEIRSAASTSKVLPTAMEDAMILAERVFEVGEDGKVVTRDGVGVTPGLAPQVWLQEMQDKRPHWWPASGGGGASGPGGGGNRGKNPWSHEHWNMTEQGQILRADRAKAEQLAKSAGTTVGGKRPTPKAV